MSLKESLKLDKKTYKKKNKLLDIYGALTFSQTNLLKKTIIISRKYRYYKDKNGFFSKLLRIYYETRFNLISRKSNVNIQGHFGNCIKVYHENIIVNQYATLGDNVVFHGNNCIGNDGKNIKNCPIIGNNVDIGFGATIIGNIEIADDIVIGANSLVNKSFKEKGIVIAGVPAKKIK